MQNYSETVFHLVCYLNVLIKGLGLIGGLSVYKSLMSANTFGDKAKKQSRSHKTP